MAFPRRLLIPGEDIVLDLRPHPVALALPVLVVVAELIVAIWFTVQFDFPSWIWWAIVVVIFILYPARRLIWWLTSNFAVTTERVIHREGWIAKRSMEIPLEADQRRALRAGDLGPDRRRRHAADLLGLGVRHAARSATSATRRTSRRRSTTRAR